MSAAVASCNHEASLNSPKFRQIHQHQRSEGAAQKIKETKWENFARSKHVIPSDRPKPGKAAPRSPASGFLPQKPTSCVIWC